MLSGLGGWRGCWLGLEGGGGAGWAWRMEGVLTEVSCTNHRVTVVQRAGEYGLDSRQMDSVCYLKESRGLGGDGKVGGGRI